MSKRIPDNSLNQPRQRGFRQRRLFQPDQFGVFSEAFARFMGTPSFIAWMSVVVGGWLIWNTTVPEHLRFDPYPFQFLTLALSVQASYAAPLILLAQNRQEMRDRESLDNDRKTIAQSRADTDFLAREIADIHHKMGDVAGRSYLSKRLQRIEEAILALRDELKPPTDEDPPQA